MAEQQNLVPSVETKTPTKRLLPVDALRGLIIVVMALDHANTFISDGKLAPEMWAGHFPNYSVHPPLTFLTRLVTHLAAPGFFFLMGVGMYLFAQSRHNRGWTDGQIARYFLIRGGLLIFLQFFIENMAWGFEDFRIIYFGVLYGLGGAMIAGVLLLKLPQRWLLLVSLLLIAGTELLLPEMRDGSVAYPLLERMLLLPGTTGRYLVYYPVLPWLGVTGLGIAFGRWLQQDQSKAYQGAFWLGLATWILFLGLRRAGGFGNIRPPAGDDWIAFFNVVKYPPSVVFLLLTLGTNLVILSLFARLPDRVLWPLAVFGRVPLFFYLTHLFLYRFLGYLAGPAATSIPRMYPYWLLGLVILWPLCLLYGRFKNSRPPSSLWRFF